MKYGGNDDEFAPRIVEGVGIDQYLFNLFMRAVY